jgi:hypothetical protein
MVDAELARRLATRAIALVRAGADPQAAVTVLQGFAKGDRRALVLARSRCLAASEQDPNDRAALRAVELFDAALDAGR